MRTTDEAWKPPPELDGAERVVYLSLGSLGSADVPLMRHLIEVLARSPHRFVVSMGPQHAELELAENMVGAEFLPQASLLPQVDAVITHGGNNTTTEAMWFGKPMLVLPIFWDQHDNAQRVQETGYGLRLPTYSFEDDQLLAAVDTLLTDSGLRGPLRRSRRAPASAAGSGGRGRPDRAPGGDRRAGAALTAQSGGYDRPTIAFPRLSTATHSCVDGQEMSDAAARMGPRDHDPEAPGLVELRAPPSLSTATQRAVEPQERALTAMPGPDAGSAG